MGLGGAGGWELFGKEGRGRGGGGGVGFPRKAIPEEGLSVKGRDMLPLTG